MNQGFRAPQANLRATRVWVQARHDQALWRLPQS
jgi:hypothetical protein